MKSLLFFTMALVVAAKAIGLGFTYGGPVLKQDVIDAHSHDTILIDTHVTLHSDVVVPGGTSLRFDRGGVVDLNGHVLAIDGGLEAGIFQIFEGSGRVILAPSSVLYGIPQWWGAQTKSAGGRSSENTRAFESAFRAASEVFIPAGTYLVANLALTSSDVCRKLVGTGSTTVLLGASGASTVLSVEGVGQWFIDFVVSDMTIDMSLMPDSESNVGFSESSAYGGEVSNITFRGQGELKPSILVTHSYTTEYNHCRLGAGSGRFVMKGKNWGDMVTTLLIENCDLAQVIADYAGSINIISSTLQGNGTFFVIDHSDGVNIIGCDVEGHGRFMATQDSKHVMSMGNFFSGYLNPHYLPQTIPSQSWFADRGERQYGGR